MPKVKSFKSIGKHQTYDLEVDHPDHQFYLANGLLTSNSHAVSYGIDSYMCAWLLTYYEPEWLCAYMETQSNQPDKRSKAISELMAFQYEIVKVDINHASKKWTIMPDKKFMPSFLTVKGVGESAVDEISLNRPYKGIKDLLWKDDGSWKHSKFNKRSLENLIKIGAFDSMDIVGPGKVFTSYKQMHHVLIENNQKIKNKKMGRDAFEEALVDSYDMKPWDKDERVAMSKALVGVVDLNLIITKALRDKLRSMSVTSIDEYENEYDPDLMSYEEVKKLHWFIVEDVERRKSKKGKPYMFLTVSGESGKRYKMYCWSWNPEKQEMLERNMPYIGELELGEYGFSTSLARIRSIREKKQKDAA